MNKKYSNIKDKLQIVVDKKTNNDLAYLTHYFHNYKNGISQYYKPSANEYLTKLHKKLNIVQEPDFEYYLPIKWDIPFPPTEKPTFTFIDLFAGIGGIRLAYQNNGGKCVFTSEWDAYAKKTYEANFIGGRMDGKELIWDENGAVISEITYRSGKIDETEPSDEPLEDIGLDLDSPSEDLELEPTED